MLAKPANELLVDLTIFEAASARRAQLFQPALPRKGKKVTQGELVQAILNYLLIYG
jgi:hypothetical protein